MKQLLKSILIILLLVVGLLSCKKKEQTRIQTSWSAKDPVAIPLNTRLNQQKIDNLIPNYSFEAGKVLFHQSNIKTFSIDGWKVIGEKIEWVNKNNVEYKFHEVFHGNHSVKINKSYTDETEEAGVGILSDYIRVIPGNYRLNMNLRFKDIKSDKERLGFKLYDAVNIRIKYYDKNKIELVAKEKNLFDDSKIDIGFKSLSLASFWEIKEQNWINFYGKSAYYPFFDGDIPDKARYVKIFIGLKGTGTLWVDNVNYTYTKDNFTLLENMQKYFDTSIIDTQDSIKNNCITNLGFVCNTTISAQDIDFLHDNGLGDIYFLLNSDLVKKQPNQKYFSLCIDGKQSVKYLKGFGKKDYKRIKSVLIKNIFDLSELEDVISFILRKNRNIEILYKSKYSSIKEINRSQNNAQEHYQKIKQIAKGNVKLIWTGENEYSNSIDCMNKQQVQQTMKSAPILLDNNILKNDKRLADSLIKSYYPGKIRVLSLFQPYKMNKPDTCAKMSERKVIIGLDSISEINKIKLLTAVQYYSNAPDYHPEKSLWLILNKLYGRDIAISLLKFDDAVSGINEMLQKITNNGLNNKDERIINIYKKNLEKEYQELQNLNLEDKLLEEIEAINTHVLINYNNTFKPLNNFKK